MEYLNLRLGSRQRSESGQFRAFFGGFRKWAILVDSLSWGFGKIRATELVLFGFDLKIPELKISYALLSE